MARTCQECRLNRNKRFALNCRSMIQSTQTLYPDPSASPRGLLVLATEAEVPLELLQQEGVAERKGRVMQATVLLLEATALALQWTNLQRAGEPIQTESRAEIAEATTGTTTDESAAETGTGTGTGGDGTEAGIVIGTGTEAGTSMVVEVTDALPAAEGTDQDQDRGRGVLTDGTIGTAGTMPILTEDLQTIGTAGTSPGREARAATTVTRHTQPTLTNKAHHETEYRV